jgi:hypothetical protein
VPPKFSRVPAPCTTGTSANLFDNTVATVTSGSIGDVHSLEGGIAADVANATCKWRVVGAATTPRGPKPSATGAAGRRPAINMRRRNQTGAESAGGSGEFAAPSTVMPSPESWNDCYSYSTTILPCASDSLNKTEIPTTVFKLMRSLALRMSFRGTSPDAKHDEISAFDDRNRLASKNRLLAFLFLFAVGANTLNFAPTLVECLSLIEPIGRPLNLRRGVTEASKNLSSSS